MKNKAFKFNYRILVSSIDGMAFHTALRKVCDSDMTSIAYNAITLIDDRDWENYIKFLQVCNSTVHCFSPKTAVAKQIKEWSLSWGKNHLGMSPTAIILAISFKYFTDEDWDGYCSYISVRKVKIQ